MSAKKTLKSLGQPPLPVKLQTMNTNAERFATRYVFFVFRWNTFLDQYKAALDEVNGIFVGGLLTPDNIQTAPHTAKHLFRKLKHPHSQHDDVFPVSGENVPSRSQYVLDN
ncbi:hypothetical protein OUZ56_006847 [Daphnia magna]|uniref:Uncharacterized protein n=1 Tax=Daphnia magna TaxID=35525 RepID=A0ABQ9YX00_9CRUS|nr:hypothetical protein OUZ56_006847 [Daphnia magna]